MNLHFAKTINRPRLLEELQEAFPGSAFVVDDSPTGTRVVAPDSLDQQAILTVVVAHSPMSPPPSRQQVLDSLIAEARNFKELKEALLGRAAAR